MTYVRLQADCSASHQGEGGAFADPPTKGPLDVGTLNGMFACWGPTRCAVTASCCAAAACCDAGNGIAAVGAPACRCSCGELIAWAVATGISDIMPGSMLCGSACAIGMPKALPPAWWCCCQLTISAMDAMPASWTPWPSCGMS